MGTEIEKYGWVNALRGYAILLVVFVHAGQHYAMFNHMQVLTHVGDLGVQLFFILSSFTLFNSYSKRRMYEDGFVKRGFFIRRFFRIAPYYYFAGLLYVAYAVLVSHESINAAGLVASFTFTNGLYLPAINYLPPGGWSVGVEMLFYVTIPVLFKYLDTL
jgi:peptidoglycan/LPS O-acetylase OafA/YrhL